MGCVCRQVCVEGKLVFLIAWTPVCLCKHPAPRGQTYGHFETRAPGDCPAEGGGAGHMVLRGAAGTGGGEGAGGGG